LLDLSRFESGRLALRPEPAPPGFIIQRLLHHFGALAQHQGVNLAASAPPDLPPIRVDEPSLDRVLANLLVNALAATPRGDEIQVKALHGADRREVEIIVMDTGCGLSPEDQEHLFEKYRLSRNKHDGSGLGLYICKTLVEANQGRIWAESLVGQGATFHLVFPAVREDEEPPVAPESQTPDLRKGHCLG
jgi:cell cycle sensor histidine kinase DivJ